MNIGVFVLTYREQVLYLGWGVGRNSGWTKRGQTVVGTEIQTSCNFKASLPDRYYHLGYFRCLFSNVVLNPLLTLWCGIIAIPLFLIISIFSYTNRIFLSLRRHNTQIHSHNVQQENQTNQLNIARNKRALSTAIWLQLTLVACYLPHGVVIALRANSFKSA